MSNKFEFFDRFLKHDTQKTASARHVADTINYVNSVSGNQERRISTCFNILFSECPETLTQYIYLAAAYDKELFSEFLKMDQKFFLKKSEYSRFTETPICAVSRISNVSEKEILSTLISQIYNPSTFVSGIVNTQSNTPLKVIESVLQLKCNSDASIYKSLSGRHNNNDFIAQLLYQAGCSIALNQKLSRKSKRHLHEIYGAEDESALPFSSPIKTKSLRSIAARLNKYRESNSVMMMMLSFYSICYKVLSNSQDYGLYNIDCTKSDKLSVPLAAGSFITARKLCYKANLYFNFKTESDFKEIESKLPSFDEYFAFLTNYIEGKIRTVACGHCGAPYFNLTNRVNKKMGCPHCSQNCYYNIEEKTQRNACI